MMTDVVNPKHFYDKPKILLVDLDDTTATAVQKAGFNIARGTFGVRYKLSPQSGHLPVVLSYELPNHTEQDVIFIDLKPPRTVPYSEHAKINPRVAPLWANGATELIDPRPFAMSCACDDFDRILEYGGLFVIFAWPRRSQEFLFGDLKHNQLNIRERHSLDNWSFLPTLSDDTLQVMEDEGREIMLADGVPNSVRTLSKYLSNGRFHVCLSPLTYWLEKAWNQILVNKYGDSVGVLIHVEGGQGGILILPQIKDKATVVVKLLQDLLPNLSPEKFPHFEGLRWVERPEYELLPVLEYKARQENIRKQAQAQVAEIEGKIDKKREEFSFLHGVLTKTGGSLARDVKSCLEQLGFPVVVDVDAEPDRKALEEDLRIEEQSPVIVVEVKGLSGLPREDDAISVVKYVARRMRELDRRDVRGLVIVNHQRHLPPLDRNNKQVFTERQIADAENHSYTLATSWDIFRLIRGIEVLKWPLENVRSLLSTDGRMPGIPTHYEPVGKIVKFWPEAGAVSILIERGSISIGDRLGFVLPTEFLEQEITSLEIEQQKVTSASKDQKVGIGTTFNKEQLIRDAQVCLCKS